MASVDLRIKVQDHGTALDDKKTRVKCNHCGKVVSGFSRLKYHLGGVRGDVVPCSHVPTDVKEVFNNELLEKKRGNLSKEVGETCSANLESRRNSLPHTSPVVPLEPELIPTSALGSGKRLKTTPSEVHGTESVSLSKTAIGSQSALSNQSSAREFHKRVGRFFYENGIDFEAARSPSFQRMISADLGCGETARTVPSCEDLKGWILQETLEEMQQYVMDIRQSWASTGCTILLDGWKDSRGRNLLIVLAACPKGIIYVRSADISDFDQQSDVMMVFFDEVLKEVGVENVVQIITYSSSAWMEEVGKQVMEKYKTLFWTVSAPHCLQLMLEKISMMSLVRRTLERAKTITRFVHSDARILKLLRDQASAHGLVRPSKFKFIVPFLTLEHMVIEKESLQRLFCSAVWKTSRWDSTIEGKRVADLVADHSFWAGAGMVLKGTIPLVRALDLITKNDDPQIGYIYETMDQVKETIKEGFKHKKSTYMSFWKAIDNIWNKYLHSPLHAAGYFLNPKLFYANGFYADTEVASGLLCSVVRLAENPGVQDLATLQVEEYRIAEGAFSLGKVDLQSNASPESWWLTYGRGHPELQRLAIRILSQTCNGASKYNLKKWLAEQLLTDGRNPIEQQRLAGLVFVHYNLQLQNFNVGVAHHFPSDDIDPMGDWVVQKAQPDLSQSGELTWMDLDFGDTTNAEGEGDLEHSGFQPKVEA